MVSLIESNGKENDPVSLSVFMQFAEMLGHKTAEGQRELKKRLKSILGDAFDDLNHLYSRQYLLTVKMKVNMGCLLKSLFGEREFALIPSVRVENFHDIGPELIQFCFMRVMDRFKDTYFVIKTDEAHMQSFLEAGEEASREHQWRHYHVNDDGLNITPSISYNSFSDFLIPQPPMNCEEADLKQSYLSYGQVSRIVCCFKRKKAELASLKINYLLAELTPIVIDYANSLPPTTASLLK